MFVINPKSLGIAGGIIWGVAMLLLTWLSMITGYATIFLSLMVDIYPGYSVSFFGSIIGLVYGFIDAFVFLFLLGWLYNFIEH